MKIVYKLVICLFAILCTVPHNALSLAEPTSTETRQIFDKYGAIGGYNYAKNRAKDKDPEHVYIFYKYLLMFGDKVYVIDNDEAYQRLSEEELSALRCTVQTKNDTYVSAIIYTVNDERLLKYKDVRTCLSKRVGYNAVDNYNFCGVENSIPDCFLNKK